MSDKNVPSLVRLQKIAYYLERDDRYKDRYSQEPQAHPKGKVFGRIVWQTAEAISAAGKDPCALGKKELLAYAETAQNAAPAEVAPTEAPVAEPAAGNSPGADDATLNLLATDPGSFHLPFRISIVTMLAAAHELTRLDKAPDAPALRKQLEGVLLAYHKSSRTKK